MDKYFGVIEERVSDSDWLGADIELKCAPKGTSSFLLNGATQYNQKDVSPVSCTVHGAMGAYSDLTGYKFSLDEREEIWQEALNRGADPDVGWYINSAVDLVRQWVNANLPEKVSSYRLRVGSNDFGMAMRLGYSPVVGYRGNQLYNLDKSDGVLNDTEFTDTTYGHCIRTNYSVGDEFDRMVDNYPYNNINLYLVPTINWKKLVLNRVFFEHAYIYIIN